jgi:rfaE bifunctional protein nucleotidyltransferase chain/domain
MTAGKVLPLADLVAVRDRLHREGKVVVFTNGCFDLLHVGHVRLLQEARSLGDVLIVGLNGDDSIRRLKGPGRPILSLPERSETLAALACVDYVTSFDEDTPERMIAALRPDIPCKGGDYAGRSHLAEQRAAASYGARIRILGLTPGRSSTSIVDEVLARYCKSRQRRSSNGAVSGDPTR